jgi:hypothetical protein
MITDRCDHKLDKVKRCGEGEREKGLEVRGNRRCSDRPDGFLRLPFLLKVRNATPRLYNRLLGHNITTVPSFQKKTGTKKEKNDSLLSKKV